MYFGMDTPLTVWLSPSITRNRAKKMGSGSSMGRQAPKGLTPCSRNNSIWAWAKAWRSFLCLSWSFLSSGWIFCIASIDLVLLRLSGDMSAIQMMLRMMMATP